MKYYTLSEMFFKEETLWPKVIEEDCWNGITTLQLKLKGC